MVIIGIITYMNPASYNYLCFINGNIIPVVINTEGSKSYIYGSRILDCPDNTTSPD